MLTNRFRVILVALMLSVQTTGVSASLIQSPELPAPGTVGMEAMPPEIREAFSQGGVATLPELVLAERSAQLRDVVVNNPADPYPLHALGTVTYHLDGVREAMALWQNAADRDPNLAPAEVMAAVHAVFAALHRGETSQARRQLNEAEKRFETQPHFQLIRAEQAMRSRNVSEAGRAFEKAYALAPDLYVTALNLGRFYEFTQHEPSAILALYEQASRLAPERAEVWHYLGTMQLRLDQPEAALASFRRLHDLVPESPLPQRRLAEHSFAAGDMAAAERWFRAALDLPLSADEAAEIRGALGDVLLRLGEVEDARTEIEAALAHREQPPLMFALATLDEADGKPDLAERRYRQVLEVMPGHPLASNNLAMLLLKADRAPEEALQLAEQAREGIPGNAIIESTYGCALSRLGRHDEAIAILEPAVEVLVDDGWTHFCLGRSLVADGRQEDALKQLKLAVELEPDLLEQTGVQGLLEGIR